MGSTFYVIASHTTGEKVDLLKDVARLKWSRKQIKIKKIKTQTSKEMTDEFNYIKIKNSYYSKENE